MLVIKKVGKESCEIVADIIRKAFARQAEILGINETEYPNYAAFETTERVNKSIDNGEIVLLAWLNDEPIGTVRYYAGKKDPKRGFISRLAILPEHRGKAYGKVLLEYAESKLIQMGVEEIGISIVKSFEKLEKYYKGQGFKYLKDQTFPTLPFEVRFMDKRVGKKGVAAND